MPQLKSGTVNMIRTKLPIVTFDLFEVRLILGLNLGAVYMSVVKVRS